MKLLSSWKESLEIFYPKNFKTFVLLTLNAWLQTWKVGWVYFVTILALFCWSISGITISFLMLVAHFIKYAAAHTLIALYLMAVRPSVTKKNYSYFLHMVWSFGIQLVLLSLALPYVGPIMPPVIFEIFVVYTLFFIMFLLDSSGDIFCLRSLKNAAVFFLYNLPLVVLGIALQVLTAVLLLLLLYFGYSSIADDLRKLDQGSAMLNFCVFSIGFVALTLYLTFWVGVYVKRTRDDAALYT